MSEVEFVKFTKFKRCKDCIHYDTCKAKDDIFSDPNFCLSYKEKYTE